MRTAAGTRTNIIADWYVSPKAIDLQNKGKTKAGRRRDGAERTSMRTRTGTREKKQQQNRRPRAPSSNKHLPVSF